MNTDIDPKPNPKPAPKPKKGKTKEQRDAAKERRKKVARNKHFMEVVRTSCSSIGLAVNLFVLVHIYWK